MVSGADWGVDPAWTSICLTCTHSTNQLSRARETQFRQQHLYAVLQARMHASICPCPRFKPRDCEKELGRTKRRRRKKEERRSKHAHRCIQKQVRGTRESGLCLLEVIFSNSCYQRLPLSSRMFAQVQNRIKIRTQFFSWHLPLNLSCSPLANQPLIQPQLVP